MPVPSPRNKILPARGNFADLSANVASLLDGEICYAIDQDQYYQNEGGTLISVGATKAQGLLADTSVQPGDNVSDLTNDAGYITIAEVPDTGVTSVNGDVGPAVVLDKADIGLENVDNTSDADKPISTATQSALGLKADLVGGVIPTSQIPAVAITEFLGSVDSETEMLALVGQPGDWCLRTDVAVGYVIVGADPSVIAGWEAFTVPGSAVTSINSQVGTVVLGASDVGALPATVNTDDITEGSTNLYSQWDNATGGINYAGGKVGIGTTDPTEPLDVLAIAGSRIQLGDSGFANVPAIIARTSTDNGYRNLGFDAASHRFYVSNAEKMRIDDNGRLLVGTTSARANFNNVNDTTKLQIEGTTYINSAFSIVRNSDNNASGGIIIAKTRSTTVGGAGQVNDGDSLGKISFQGQETQSAGNNLVQAAKIEAYVDGTPGANDMPGLLTFATTADGATTPTERMRIQSDGNVGIGTEDPDDKLEIGGNGAGIILASPNGTRYRVTVADDGTLTTTAVT